jgi:hypothetical protein
MNLRKPERLDLVIQIRWASQKNEVLFKSIYIQLQTMLCYRYAYYMIFIT